MSIRETAAVWRFKANWKFAVKKIVLTVLLYVALGPTLRPAFAGDLFIFNKTGFMDWSESIVNGNDYISETGVTEEFGGGYRGNVAGIELTPSAAIWGSVFAYDGVHADTLTPWKTITGDFGVKGALDVAVPIQLSENLNIAPTAGTGVNYFVRSVGPEYWVVLTVKAGLRASYKGFTASAGAMLPYYTSDSIDWTDIGMNSSVTVRPKGQVSPYAEVSYRTGKWEFGAFFEQMKWDASDLVPYKQFTNKSPAAVIAVNGSLYQPDTVINHGGLSVVYHF